MFNDKKRGIEFASLFSQWEERACCLDQLNVDQILADEAE